MSSPNKAVRSIHELAKEVDSQGRVVQNIINRIEKMEGRLADLENNDNKLLRGIYGDKDNNQPGVIERQEQHAKSLRFMGIGVVSITGLTQAVPFIDPILKIFH